MVDRAQKKVIAISVLVVFIMILSSAFLGGNLIKGRNAATPIDLHYSGSAKSSFISDLYGGKFTTVPVAPNSVKSNLSKVFNGTVSVMVTFSFNNQSRQ